MVLETYEKNIFLEASSTDYSHLGKRFWNTVYLKILAYFDEYYIPSDF